MKPQQTLLPLEPFPDEETSDLATDGQPTPTVSPAAPAQREAFLRERLLAKARASRSEQLGHVLITAAQGPWQTPAAGVRLKLLQASPQGQSMLLELAAGARYSPPAEVTHEECLVLRGHVQVGPSLLTAGDYLLVPRSEVISEWLSPSGAQLFLRLALSSTS